MTEFSYMEVIHDFRESPLFEQLRQAWEVREWRQRTSVIPLRSLATKRWRERIIWWVEGSFVLFLKVDKPELMGRI